MTSKECIEYIKTFPEDSEVGFIAVNPSKDVRLQYPVQCTFGISDMERPVFCLEVGEGVSMDDEPEGGNS